ncbi:PP2C family protein-serine/threonine phosphatase [Dictyobacter arantiisoli]|uniref:Serine/threonine phosphatase n=1 Tax=Dictyobacter arantiisoli TaxID=2014874 RepID=A0A5A5TIA2_9CHLR|nr:PP2C family serine/threonine-protein phosphatase [Dictyobacter arantiisoli]GCF11127.1 serine/threonine phosphatase [Dictyobacter arantiisoli]
MAITMRSSSRSTTTSPALTFVKYSVPHEGHTNYNDDTILLDRRRGLAAVFDGVGSGPGQLASRLAAHVVRHIWKNQHTGSGMLVAPTTLDLDAILVQMFEEAHTQILLEAERRARNARALLCYPATTAALALFCQQEQDQGYSMHYAHVGDSRIYLWRADEGLQRLTEDDGYLSLRLQDGSITQEDALRIDQATSIDQLSELEKEYFDNRNGITQALGHDKPLLTHLGQIDILPGDRVLICSDGIHDNLTDQILAELLATSTRSAAAKKVVQQAIETSHRSSAEDMRAKSDDMSAVVITCNMPH